MVDESRSPISQVEWTKKQYTASDVNRAERKSRFDNITIQPVNQIIHVVVKNILKNLPILREDVGLAEYIYGPSVSYLQVKTVLHKI